MVEGSRHWPQCPSSLPVPSRRPTASGRHFPYVDAWAMYEGQTASRWRLVWLHPSRFAIAPETDPRMLD